MIMNFLHNLFIRRDIKSQVFLRERFSGKKQLLKSNTHKGEHGIFLQQYGKNI